MSKDKDGKKLPPQTSKDKNDSRYDEPQTFGKGWTEWRKK